MRNFLVALLAFLVRRRFSYFDLVLFGMFSGMIRRFGWLSLSAWFILIGGAIVSGIIQGICEEKKWLPERQNKD